MLITFKTLLVALLLTSSGIVNAGNLFKESWNIITDPLKLGSAGKNILKSVERADMMLDKADKILVKADTMVAGQVVDIDLKIKNHIDNIDSIISDTLDDVDNILIKVVNLEQKIYEDTMSVVTCGSERAGASAEKTLAEMLNILGASKPAINLFGFIPLFEADFEESDIKNPFAAYTKTKRLFNEKLRTIKETDNVREILDLYANMPRVARLTACHTEVNDSERTRLIRDEFEYERLHRAWKAFI